MCWSLLLLTIWEAARDDAVGAKKRAERAAEKKREQDGEGGNLDVATDALTSDDELREASFRKHWHQNLSWVQAVLEDAVAYARTNKARTQDTLDHSKHENKISSLFYSSLWPSLKGRGWKEEAVSHGKHFTYDEYRVSSSYCFCVRFIGREDSHSALLPISLLVRERYLTKFPRFIPS